MTRRASLEENAPSAGQMSALQSLDKDRLRWISASLGLKRFYLVETYFPPVARCSGATRRCRTWGGASSPPTAPSGPST